MKQIPEGVTRLLLVEGRDDREFFFQLSQYLGLTEDKAVDIIEYEGKDNLQKALGLLRSDPRFPFVTHIAITRDADFDGNALIKVQSALKNANQRQNPYKQYPVPEQVEIFTEADMQVGIFVLPDAKSNGMLETLILRALQEDTIMQCVEQYFSCLETVGITTKPEPLPKAQVEVYMAAVLQKQIQAYIQGKHVDVETTGKDRNRSYLSDIYKMTWWSWEHPAFDGVKQFIQQLVNAS